MPKHSWFKQGSEIWDSHSNIYEECGLLDCNVVQLAKSHISEEIFFADLLCGLLFDLEDRGNRFTETLGFPRITRRYNNRALQMSIRL
jgi:hypothetical protein